MLWCMKKIKTQIYKAILTNIKKNKPSYFAVFIKRYARDNNNIMIVKS